MNTELYNILQEKLLDSELSKRAFCREYKIPHAWFIEFMNPEKRFRPLQVKTQGLLRNHLGISFEVTDAYNKAVRQGRV